MHSRRARFLGLAASLMLAVVLGGSVRWIPVGSVGLRGDRIMGPGWHVRPPYSRFPVFPSNGELAIEDLDLSTREGSALVFRLDLSYTVGARLAPAFAVDLHRGGMNLAVATLARRVLEDAARRVDAESLLASASLVEAPLRIALQASGIGVARLSLRSPLGDEIARRRASEEARTLMRRAHGSVIAIGWDGADWDSLGPLLAAGRMPHLARLLATGAHGDLRSYDPMFSPLLWTTVATGKAPTEHGIADFVVKDVRTKSRRLITSDFRRVKALWNVFSDVGRRSAWLAWWASYPAEPIDGVVVSDLLSSAVISGGTDRAAATAHVATPADFLEGRKHLLAPISSLTREDVARFFPVPADEWTAAIAELNSPKPHEPRKTGEEDHQNPTAFVCRVLSATRTYHALAKDLVRSRTPFVAVYYEAIDMMGHRFQHFRPPKMAMVGAADYERFKDAVTRWYEYQDELLGDLLAEASKDTIVVILSDHGFLTGEKRPEGVLPYTSVQPAEWHRDWGIIAMHGPGVRAGRIPPASIYDLAPTLLYLAGLPLAKDMPGRLVESAFEPATLRKAPPTSIRSYELVGTRLERGPAAVVDTAAMDEMMANLRALGYVGGEPAGPSSEASPDREDEGGEARADTQVYYHRNLAVSHIKQGRFSEAEGELLAANQRKPLGKTYSMLSEVRATQGRYADAATALEEGWGECSDLMEPSSLLWIVDLYLLAGDRNGASEALARWSNTMEPAVREAAEGRIWEAKGDDARAATLYRGALRADPLLVRIAQRLYDIDQRYGRPGALEPLLLATLAKYPLVDAYWDLAGQIAMARGDAPTAAGRFRKAVDLQPENGLYIGHFATASVAAGRSDAGREALAWAERFPPREGGAWMALGSAWDRLGETNRAVEAFEKAREFGLAGPSPDLGAALALARAGRRSEAQLLIQDAARRFPGNRAVLELQSRLD